MTITYKLDAQEEGERLEEQSTRGNYSILHEILAGQMLIQNGDQVLDAGCGTGLLSRGLVDLFERVDFKVDAIDITDSLLDFAQSKVKGIEKYQGRITFKKQNISELKLKEVYDKIFSRFVFQHIPSRDLQLKASRSLYEALRPGGSLLVIDTFGLFSHLETENAWVQEKIQLLERKIPIDMNVGMKLRRIFLEAGVPLAELNLQVQNFSVQTSEERSHEAGMWKMRFQNAYPLLEDVLGQKDARQFSEAYVGEILNPKSYYHPQKVVLCINKQ